VTVQWEDDVLHGVIKERLPYGKHRVDFDDGPWFADFFDTSITVVNDSIHMGTSIQNSTTQRFFHVLFLVSLSPLFFLSHLSLPLFFCSSLSSLFFHCSNAKKKKAMLMFA